MEYSNETSTNFSLASSELIRGINHQSLEMILAMLGITQQYTKKMYHENQKKLFHPICEKTEKSANQAFQLTCEYIKNIKEKILPISFDVSWSHVRNTNQASSEFIFAKKLDKYPYKSIFRFHYIEKLHKRKNKNGKTVIVHEGNHAL
ncbi:unnamed protein product [Rhizophagus irregularis]|nr:unnamed protein product [Rhizophagus irregularis]CAB4427375.1 unnamed protein product [Rhizophagus irregularis]